MADEVAELVVKISGDASGLESTINGVASELSALEKVQGSNKGIGGTSVAAKQAERSLKQLESAMSKQKDTTLQYTKLLRDSSAQFREKQTAMQNTAKAYKTNTAVLKENGENLRYQVKLLDGTVATNKEHIASLRSENKYLKRNSSEYKMNMSAIKSIQAENAQLKNDRKLLTTAILDNDKAINAETESYKNAQSAVKQAASEYRKARENVTASKQAEKEYSEAISQTNSKLSEQTKTIETAKSANESAINTTEKIAKSTEELKKSGKSIKDFGEGVDTLTKPIQYGAMAFAAGGVAAAKFAIDFEDSFAGVKKTVDGTPEQLDAIKQSIIDMSTVGINGHSAIPMTTSDLNELAAAGGQLGIQTENIADFTEVMAQMGTATNLVGEEGAATLARFMNVMGISQGEIRNVGSAIVDLGNNFATTEAEIADMALSMGATGSVVGISAQDVLAYSTALSSLGVDAAAGGSAVSRIWMEIQSAVSAGGEDLQKFAELSGESSSDFKKHWQEDASGAFQNFLRGLNESSDQISVLSELGFNNIRDIQALQRLAGEKGIQLLTDALERSNTAWAENTALQEEFDAKAQTTASKLQVTKQNFIETARSIGETMLPTINDVSKGLTDFARGLASMDDSRKKALVNTGAAVVALGAGAKVTTGAIKGIGDTIEAVGKIKGAKAFQSVATAIGAIPMPAKLAVAGIAALGVAGKVAYDTWYNSQYRWSEGLSEGNEKIRESLDKYKQITDIQGQVKSLKMIIENPDSSKEQVDNAKSKLEEIKQLLSEEYNLVIKSDNSNLDDAIEKVRQISKNDLQSNINQQRSKLASLKIKDANYENDLADATKKYNEYLDVQTKLSEAKEKITNLNMQVTEGELSTADAYNKAKDIYKDVMGTNYRPTDQAFDNLNGVLSAIASKYGVITEEVGKYDEKIKNLNGSHEELRAVSEELANWETELIKIASASGDNEGVSKALKDMSSFIKTGGLDLEGYAQAAALAMNGVNELETAWSQAANGDGTALNGIVKDYIRSMREFGASAQETATGAALIQNGFRSIGEAAAAGKLDVIIEQANELAHDMGLIPEEKRINISASGDLSIIDTASGRIQELQRADGTVIRVGADGDISVLNQATGQTQILKDTGAVALQVNAEGNIDVLNEAGNKVAEIKNDPSATITVNTELGETPEEAPPVNGTANFELGESPEKVPDATGTANFILGDYPTRIPPITATVNVQQQAKGTQNFSGGLAMVNDQPGIADNRELIIDRGRAFIPEGRNVILPLSKGAKVYTAAQTKAIMSGLGIPHYASGKDNSDAFTAAKDDWTHYTKTHAVTTTQELEKWVELSKKFTSNQKDVWDIQEQIFSLQQKITSELNEQSKAYIEDRMYLNDWEEYGDTALDAFGRIKERNKADLDAGKLTWEEYSDNVAEIGSAMYSDRISQSKNWLEHEEKYNSMSSADYIAGIDRMKQYTEEYYAAGIINHREYIEGKIELDEMYIDKQREMYEKEVSAWLNDADAWEKLRSGYGDWDEYGDSEVDFIRRKLQGVQELYNDGKIDFEDYTSYNNEFGLDLYNAQKDANAEIFEAWKKDANAWEKLRSGYDDWETYGDSEVSFIQRKIGKVKEFYEAGVISFEDFIDYTNDYKLDLQNTLSSAYDDMLSQQSKYISDMQQKFSEQEQKLRDSWDVSDRIEDMADVRKQLAIYKNSVTEQGVSKYKDLEKQMRQLQRDEELYDIQTSNNAVIKKLQADYEQLEKQKSSYMKQIISSNVDISAIVADMEKAVSSSNNSILSVLQDILSATKRNSSSSGGSSGGSSSKSSSSSSSSSSNSSNGFVGPVQNTTYNDNRTITVNSPSTSIYSQFADKFTAALKK